MTLSATRDPDWLEAATLVGATRASAGGGAVGLVAPVSEDERPRTEASHSPPPTSTITATRTPNRSIVRCRSRSRTDGALRSAPSPGTATGSRRSMRCHLDGRFSSSASLGNALSRLEEASPVAGGSVRRSARPPRAAREPRAPASGSGLPLRRAWRLGRLPRPRLPLLSRSFPWRLRLARVAPRRPPLAQPHPRRRRPRRPQRPQRRRPPPSRSLPGRGWWPGPAWRGGPADGGGPAGDGGGGPAWRGGWEGGGVAPAGRACRGASGVPAARSGGSGCRRGGGGSDIPGGGGSGAQEPESPRSNHEVLTAVPASRPLDPLGAEGERGAGGGSGADRAPCPASGAGAGLDGASGRRASAAASNGCVSSAGASSDPG